MKIKKILLKNYKRFNVSGIQQLIMDINNPIQIIIGTNGCGKTSLLNQLFPAATVQNAFDNGGEKLLIIDKDDDTFELSFNISGNKKVHGLMKNSSELNDNKMFNIQSELVETHIINQLSKNILTCAIKVCDMLPSQRKKLILDLNPISISPIIDNHKNVKSHIGKLKNNLSMLYSRKTALMQSKISDDELKQIVSNRSSLEKEEQHLLTSIIKLSTLIDELKNNNATLLNRRDEIDRNILNKALDIIARIERNLHRFYGFDSHEIEYTMKFIDSEMDSLLKARQSIVGDISNLNTELEEKTSLLQIASKKEMLSDIEKRINHCMAEKNRVSSLLKVNDFVFSKQDIKSFESIKDALHSVLILFINAYSRPIIKRVSYSKLINKITALKSELSYLSSEINKKKITENTLLKELNILIGINDDLPERCDKDNCYVYKNKFFNMEKMKEDVTLLTAEINKMDNKIQKLNRALIKQTDLLNVQRSYSSYLDEIRNIFSKYPVFYSVINKDEMIGYLNKNPLGILNALVQAYEHSRDVYYLEDLNSEISVLKKEYDSIKDSSSTSYELINKLIQDIHQKIAELNKKFDNNKKELETLLSRKNTYQEYNDLLQSQSRISQNIDLLDHYLTVSKSIEYYNGCIGIFNDKLDIVRSTLVDINKQIKEQESIDIRLKNEILSVIDTLELDKKKYELIEISLADLTMKYIKNFIDNLITNTNFFVNKIFEYPVEIKPIENIDDIDFKFAIDINDIMIDDINECSAGQKSIINLCFCLALIVELNLQNNPIFLDEIDSYLDTAHRQKLINLFSFLIEGNIVSQIFTTFQNSLIMEGIQADIIVLDESNVVLPEVYNTNVTIKKI